VLASGCGEASQSSRGTKAPEVVVTTPITDQVTDYQDFTGRLMAFKMVDIRARVTGFVKTIAFTDGQEVKEGQLLFEIDPRLYQADLNQAKANVKLAEADRNLQEKLANRAQELFNRKAMSLEDFETAVAAWEKSKANVKAAESARDKAQLYLDFCHVTAPLSGRASFRYVDPGNLITADTTILTTIVSEDPVYAYFDVDERTFADLRASRGPGQDSWFMKLQFPVAIRLANEEQFTHVGTADFIDNRINAGTGTIRMRGLFKNRDGMLKSGLFARIRLPLGAPYRAILIPDEALQSDQGKKFLFIVNEKNQVLYRTVELGQAIKGLRVIKKGLTEGERVIVKGMQKVRAGAQVRARMQPPPKKPDAPLVKLLTIHQGAQVEGPAKKDGKSGTLEPKGGKGRAAVSP
jgi:RND family efflux transporter MFP subunit